MKKFRLALVVLLFAGAAHAADAPRFTPIEVNISKEIVTSVTDPAQQAALLALIESAQNGINLVSDVPVNPPASRFDISDKAQIIDMSDLFIKPASDVELRQLSQNADGSRKLLTTDQLSQIGMDGTFVVPSVKYPGQNYVFKLSAFFQVGAKNISIRMNKMNASALRNVTIVVPMLATGKYNSLMSAKNGLKSIVYGLRGGLSQIVGLTEMRPKYSDFEVTAIIAKQKEAYKAEALKTAAASDLRTDLGFTPDLRLFDDELMNRAMPVIQKIDSAIADKWDSRTRQAGIVRAEIAQRFSKANLSPNALDEKVSTLFAIQRETAHHQALLTDAQLNALSPGLGQLLVNRARALQIVSDGEKQISEEVAQKRNEIFARVQAQEKLRSLIPEWMEEKVDAETNRYYQEIVGARYTHIAQQLRTDGLGQEAFLFEKNVQFAFDQEKTMEAGLKKQVQAADEFIFKRPIFRSSNWIITKTENNGDVRYSAETTRERTISTASMLWRLQAFLAGTETTTKYSIEALLYTNLWNGPIGVKSLFKKNAFPTNPRVNSSTGKIEYTSDTSTLRSRLADMTASIREERAEFEASNEHGLFGKGIMRNVLRAKHGLLKYGGGSVLALGQTVLTLGNAVTSTAVAGTSPLWSPVLNLMLIGVNAGVYDFYNPRSPQYRSISSRAVSFFSDLSPLLNRFLFRSVLVKGVLQTSISAVGIPTVTATAGLGYSWSNISSALLYLKDRSIRELMDGRAGVPSKTMRGIVTLVQGPGLARDYYYQVEPSLATVAIWARLEQEAFAQYQRSLAETIATPQVQYRDFTGIFGEFIGLREFAGRPAIAKQIADNVATNTKLVNDALAPQSELYRKLLNIPKGAQIRMTETDLAATTAVVKDLVYEFLRSVSSTWTPEQKTEFWTKRNLNEGDYNGIVGTLMAETFSPEFLTPLEKMDSDFRLNVRSPGLSDMADAVVDGRRLQPSDTVSIAHSGASMVRSCSDVFKVQ